MKFAIPEISWHNRDPVLSVDFQPKSETNGPLRLASGGTDTHVLIWYISNTKSGTVKLEVAADLTRHQKAVNVVRWSPNGEYLASGDDESIIFIWKQKTDEKDLTPTLEQGEEPYKEIWVVHKTLRGHMEDVLDMSWSPDSLQLASGSVDNKLIVWDVSRGRHTNILSDHKGFVQGVAWDPMKHLIATASTDRVFRMFDVTTKKVVSRSSKAILPFPSSHPLHGVTARLYHDDTLQTYYRRLQFSPDGLLVAVPAGIIEPDATKLDTKPMNAVYIYTRYCLKTPACVLPCGEPALVARWSPVRYQLRERGPSAAFPLRARLVLAVGTRRAVILYDTQQRAPLALISNMHYTRLTDLTWSPDGRTLVAASTDGYCSVINFTASELGEPILDDHFDVLTNTKEETANNPMEPHMELKEAKSIETKPTTSNTPKIDSFIKFKAPTSTEKSPKKRKTDNKTQKTPVKLDVLVETAMPSWSDNSNNEIIQLKETEPMEVDRKSKDNITDVIEIDDSQEFKLVYEESKDGKSSTDATKSKDIELCETPKSIKQIEPESMEVDSQDIKLIYDETQNKNITPKETSNNTKKSPERNIVSPKQTNTPKSSLKTNNEESSFFKQAKVTDIKESVASAATPSPKTPRRVNFITLSSPKNPKKKL